jgi:CO dehydrogenase maturation factor
MSIIVFSGKGGTGKTTLSALSIKYFTEKKETTLVLDFDPDSHLYKFLGVQLKGTLGQMVDRIHKEKKAEIEPKKPIDLSDQEYFVSLIDENVIVEEEEFDLLTLGKPSIEIDCYCPAFLWSEYAIAQIMKRYGITYKNVVVDCDPGTEIYPRKILDNIAYNSPIDYILTVLDGSKMSIDTAKDIVDEVKRINLNVMRVYAICNRVDDVETQNRIREFAEEKGIEVIGFVPTDPEISKRSLMDQNIFKATVSPSYQAVKNIMKNLGT